MSTPIVPNEPLKVALIGTGFRATDIYSPLFSSLAPWLVIVAVCDPVKENADRMANKLNVRAYYDIHNLVKDRPMEAAIVVTPVESHHSISVYLSSHGIHNITETTWCSMLIQAKEMIDTARKNNVIVRVAENFFHFPIDRFAKAVRDSKYLGEIKRIFSYNDHTGYHNDSRWIVFAGHHPVWVQSIEHAMNTGEFYSTRERYHNKENFHARYFQFPNDFMVIDQASNAKGFLGRLSRPGYTEWHGERGTLVHQSTFKVFKVYKYYKDGSIVDGDRVGWGSETELRYCSDDSFGAHEPFRTGGYADHVSHVKNEYEGHNWIRTYAETPLGTLQYVNPHRPSQRSVHFLDEYGSAIMAHLIDFVLAVRGLQPSEFNEQDALMSLMMELGARESVRQEGKRIALPLDGDLETDQLIRASIKKKYGIDPLDVEGMLSISYPKP